MGRRDTKNKKGAYLFISHYLCIPLPFLLRGIIQYKKKIFYAKKEGKIFFLSASIQYPLLVEG